MRAATRDIPTTAYAAFEGAPETAAQPHTATELLEEKEIPTPLRPHPAPPDHGRSLSTLFGGQAASQARKAVRGPIHLVLPSSERQGPNLGPLAGSGVCFHVGQPVIQAVLCCSGALLVMAVAAPLHPRMWPVFNPDARQ